MRRPNVSFTNNEPFFYALDLRAPGHISRSPPPVASCSELASSLLLVEFKKGGLYRSRGTPVSTLDASPHGRLPSG
jgi:hypothetical protein